MTLNARFESMDELLACQHRNSHSSFKVVLGASAFLVFQFSLSLAVSHSCHAQTVNPPSPTKSSQDFERDFHQSVLPLLKQHCAQCHAGPDAEAKFDIHSFDSTDSVSNALSHWQWLVTRVELGDMPPAEVSNRPTKESIHLLKNWTTAFRRQLAISNDGDPGVVGTRRLNHAEYNNTIHEITGVDIKPTSAFPIDPANEAGFDNSAESLTISPALVSKYLDAARFVAEHMVLAPDELRFADHPVITDTDRDRYCVHRIMEFYRKQPIQLAPYFESCWILTRPDNTLSLTDIARNHGLSSKYLESLYEQLILKQHSFGPLASLQRQWKERIEPCTNISQIKMACSSLADFVMDARQKLVPKVELLKGPKELHHGTQSLVLWFNRQVASQRRKCRSDIFRAETFDPEGPLTRDDFEALRSDAESVQQAYHAFCDLFPDAFVVVERGRPYAKEEKQESKGRLLSAGFHSMMGYFRDDQPLYDLILDAEQQSELDRLWNDFACIAQTPVRQYAGFIWFERAESRFIRESQFDIIRAEDRSATSESMIQKFATLYLEKLRKDGASDLILETVEFHFQDINQQIRHVERQMLESEQKHRLSMIDLASRAFRRPLSDAEKSELTQLYREARALPGADHRSAMEDTLVSILMSPNFLYRWDLQIAPTSSNLTSRSNPLSNLELANRLSYFLWSSAPDEVLSREASEAHLTDENALQTQVHRMLADKRSKDMLRVFAGNWLDFRRFESHQGVDREQFTAYDDKLQIAMANEPIEFLWDLIQRNGSLYELIDSEFLMVNKRLAMHYQIPLSLSMESESDWIRTKRMDSQRGGLLSMGVFLTQNSPGLRTSPVKRGYWVVRRFLGERIPPPPPNVPELPKSEKNSSNLSIRDLLAKHREHPSCAACHERFDSMGLLLEGFDPIGRPRSTDLAGRPVSSDANLPNGKTIHGLSGLRELILKERFEDFRRSFCESLLAYALGRTLIVSDDLLIDQMLDDLSTNHQKIQTVFQSIVRSQQFRTKRGVKQGKTQ